MIEAASTTRFAAKASASAQATFAHQTHAGGSGRPNTGRSFWRASRLATDAVRSETAMGSMSAYQ